MSRMPTMLRVPAARPVLEELEQRLLYSADFSPAALAGIDTVDSGEQRLLHEQQASEVEQPGVELVFIDESVSEVDSLIADLEAQREAGRPLELIRIAADEDGIARISETLADRESVAAVHVIGHGSDGVIKLGDAFLTRATALARASEVAGWSAALGDDADLLLYGCDIAASAGGQRLVADLAALTGADVAASDDTTGALLRGGDWVLEVATGAIEARAAPSELAQAQWQGELAGTYYLDGDASPPFSGLVVARPGGALLPNFDPGRNPTAGLTLQKDDASPSQADPTKHHTWAASKGGVTLANERVTFTFWTDIKNGFLISLLDAPQGKAGSVTAYLMELASANDTNGTVIASSSISDSTWGDGYTWEQKTVDFGNVTHSVSGGHHLAVKLVVNNSSDDDLWFAYGTSAYDSRLQIGSSSNIAPIVNLGSSPLSYSENLPPTVIDPLATVTDSDSPDFSGGALTVELSVNGSAADRLAVRNEGTGAGQIGVSGTSVTYGGSLIGTWSGGTDGATPLVINLSGNATIGAVQALARNITYQNTSDDPSTASRSVRFTVSDGDGGTSNGASKTVSVSAVNDAPVITSNGGGASATLSVAENGTAVTTVTATDVDASAALTYSIAGGADASRFGINDSTGALRFLGAPDYELPTDADGDNVYDVTVAVSDGILSDTQSLAVGVTNLNDNAPTITSNGGGSSASVTVPENAAAVSTITATDADVGSALTYSISGGADASRFGINAATGLLRFLAAPDYETPSDADGNNVYDVTVAVSDGSLTDTQALAVSIGNVNDNAPIITSNGGGASATTTVAENSTAVTTVIATDADVGAALTYSISGGADAGRFGINAATGVLSFLAAPDYEAPTDADGNNVYDVTVAVTDGALSDTQSLAVSVGNLNDNAPVITSNGGGASASTAVAENSTAVTTVTATDADVGATLTYSISGGADAGRFGINASTGVLSFLAAPDYEAPTDADGNNVYDVTVSVSDGSLTDTQSLAVSVGNVNDSAPFITSNGGGASATTTVAENSAGVTTVIATDADVGATLTYSISGGADAGRFGINASTGVLSFLAAPDYEAPTDADGNNVYDVTVAVSDGALSDTQALAVSVSNLNDNVPVINSNGGGASATTTVAENSAAVTTVNATDADVGATLTYSISGGADAGRFGINASTGVLSFLAAPDYEAPTDADGNNVYDVAVSVSDGTLSDTQTLAVAVGNLNDNAPVITSNGGGASANTTMAENSTAVTTVTATDADPGTSLTFSITGGADANRFGINAATGVLRFLAAPDHESPTDADGNNVYDVTVAVSDGALADTQALAVTVGNLNDNAPVITANSLVITEGGSATPLILGLDADDPAAQLTYAVSNLSGGRFELTSAAGSAISGFTQADLDAGLVRFVSDGGEAAPSYQLAVSDGTSSSAAQSAGVTYLPVNDPPAVVAIDLGSVNEDTARLITPTELLAGVVDPDSSAFDVVGLAVVGSSGTLDDNGNGTWTFTPATDWSGQAVFTFTVTDGTASVPNSATLLVDAVNDAPIVTTNSLAIVEGGSASPLITAADPDNATTQLSYTVSGLTGGRFELASAPGVAVSAFSHADLDAGLVRFVSDGGEDPPAYRITASDGALTSAARSASVDFTRVNDAPVITSDGGTAQATLNRVENAAIVTTVQAVDEESGTALLYSIDGGADAARFAIDPASGDLRFLATPNFEQPADEDLDGRYEVVVSASDGELSARQALTIVVGNENEAPVILVNALQLSGNDVTLVLRAADIDTPASSLNYAVSDLVGGHFERVDDPGKVIDSFTQADVDAGLVRLVRDGSEVTPSYLLTLTDGVSTVVSGPPDVSLIPQPVEPPVIPAVVESPAPAPAAAPPAAPADPTRSVVEASEDPTITPQLPSGPVLVTPTALTDAAIGSQNAATAAPAITDSPVLDSSLPLNSDWMEAPTPGPSATMNTDTQTGTRLTEAGADFARPPEDTALLDASLQAQDALRVALRDRELENQLNRARDQIAAVTSDDRQALGSTLLFSSSLSVGYVLWLGRGGALLASAISALPAWSRLDPLPVLAQARSRNDDPDADADGDTGHDRVEGLFARARQWLGDKEAVGARRGPE